MHKAQLELSSGKKTDIGAELGGTTSRLVLIKKEIDLIEQLKKTNSFVENRLSTMQQNMTGMIDNGQNFINQLVPQSAGTLDRALLAEIGASSQTTLQSFANVTFRGEYVFSGINTDVPALENYDSDPTSPARLAVQNAFLSEFGFNPDDPAAAALTATDLENFINGAYATLFDDTNWQALWSGSADRGIRTKVSQTETLEVSTTAFDQPFRDMVFSTVLVAEFSDSQLNATAIDKMVEISITTMSQAIATMSAEQSVMGLSQERIDNANTRISLQIRSVPAPGILSGRCRPL